MRFLHYLAGAALAFGLLFAPTITPADLTFGSPAFAQTATDTSAVSSVATTAPDAGGVVDPSGVGGVIDLGPLIDFGLEFVALLLAPLLIYVAVRWLHLNITAESRRTLQDAMDRAIAYGVARAREGLKDVGRIDTRSEILETASKYVIAATPDALRKFKIGPEGLRERLQSRLEEYTRYEAPPEAAPDTLAGETVG